MNRVELKNWSKDKVRGKRWPLLGAIIIASLLLGLNITLPLNINASLDTFIPVGWILYFVQVGLVFYLVKFINNDKPQFTDVFSKSADFVKDLAVGFLTGLFIFLWSLLLIIPGIIKSFAYALVPMLLGEDKYKDLTYTGYITKSREMMAGHKMDYFVLKLSFIGWHLLAILTLGILELWIVPYQRVAETKFLYDVKTEYEKKNK